MDIKSSDKLFVALDRLVAAIERTSVRLDLTEAKEALRDYIEEETSSG